MNTNEYHHYFREGNPHELYELLEEVGKGSFGSVYKVLYFNFFIIDLFYSKI